jgi:hypothetical protein
MEDITKTNNYSHEKVCITETFKDFNIRLFKKTSVT